MGHGLGMMRENSYATEPTSPDTQGRENKQSLLQRLFPVAREEGQFVKFKVR